MKKKQKQFWKLGDYILIPQSDGMSSLGQVVAIEPSALNSVAVSFYDIRLSLATEGMDVSPDKEKVFSMLLVTRDLLDEGVWKVIGNGPAVGLELFTELPRLRVNGFIGAKIIGSGIIIKFLNAFYKLHPWNGWYDPEYATKLLLDPGKKPKDLIYK